MLRFTKIIARTLSFRLSLMVIAALATLMMAALLIMFFFSRKAVKEEAILDADQTLEATVHHIDNILLDVEQSAGNIYWKLLGHIDQSDKVEHYTRRLVEINPYVSNCRFVWDTDSNAIDTETACWTDPMEDEGTGGEAITSFCLPFFNRQQQKVGVLAVDVPLTMLSKIVLETKPSPNSYCTLLGKNGSYIVHPDSNKLNHNVFELAQKDGHHTVAEAAESMMAGETGYKHVVLKGQNCYVFYKPFERAEVPGRAMTNLRWSAGIIYPENDIFGDYNRLLYTVLVIAFVGLVLLLLLCRVFIHSQLLPLRQLAKSAQRIADGCYDESIPNNRQQNEIGRLQSHFQQMQQSLATRMSEMQQLSDTLQERGKALQDTYEQAEGADRMKTNFLYNMSDQMMSPVSGIVMNVKTISNCYNELTEEEANRLVEEIRIRGGKVTALLNQLIADSEKIM